MKDFYLLLPTKNRWFTGEQISHYDGYSKWADHSEPALDAGFSRNHEGAGNLVPPVSGGKFGCEGC